MRMPLEQFAKLGFSEKMSGDDTGLQTYPQSPVEVVSRNNRIRVAADWVRE